MATPTQQAQRAAAEQRRAVVARMMTRRHTLTAIRDALAKLPEPIRVGLTTISNDARLIKARWLAEAHTSVDEVMARELAELDSMENDAALQFGRSPEVAWLTARLRIKEQRAKLLGLNKPERQEVSGPNGGPVTVAVGAYMPQLTDDEVDEALRRGG